jgi:hypothetical protein
MEARTARDLLEGVRRDIAALEMQLSELKRLESYLLSKVSPERDDQFIDGRSAFPPVEMVESNYLRGMTQADAAELVLKESGGGPLDTRTIVRAMVARGYKDKPERKSLLSSVFAVMSKLPNRFQKVGRGLWVLASKKEELDRQSKSAKPAPRTKAGH